MLLFMFLVVPIVIAAETEIKINNHIIKTIDGTLTSVQATEESSDELNLSGLGLHVIESGVFDNLSTLKSLNLANNSLNSLHRRLFSKLKNLENLDLANNKLSHFKDTFYGLDNLKTLNISNNPLKRLKHSEFFGLPKSVIIFTEGMNIRSISTDVFDGSDEKIPNPDEDEDADHEDVEDAEDDDDKDEDDEDDVEFAFGRALKQIDNPEESSNQGHRNGKKKFTFSTLQHLKIPNHDQDEDDVEFEFGRALKQIDNPEESSNQGHRNGKKKFTFSTLQHLKIPNHDQDGDVEDDEDDVEFAFGRTLIKKIDNPEEISNQGHQEVKKKSKRKRCLSPFLTVCIEKDVLLEVKVAEENATKSKNCRKIEAKNGESLLDLSNLGISKFKKGWCQLEFSSIKNITLEGNNITKVTKELLNDLPGKITWVDLSRNKIKRLEKNIINNYQILKLILKSNNLSEIEDGAFAKTSFKILDLTDNFINDTKFIATLPKKVIFINLSKNKIAKIAPGSFSNSGRLMFFGLRDNSIEELKRYSFQGLRRLLVLDLANNRITKIESDIFKACPNLKALNLRNNSISGFERGVFNYLHDFRFLDVGYNKLSDIKKNFPDRLPPDLRSLKIDFNKIQKFDNDSFVYSPKKKLTLDGNKISEIEMGTFDLPELVALSLNNMTLKKIDPRLFQGLKSIRHISIMANGITTIPKGLTKNLANLKVLNLDCNPIKRLENGTLYGFRRARKNLILLSHAPIEIIEGGLFDDVKINYASYTSLISTGRRCLFDQLNSSASYKIQETRLSVEKRKDRYVQRPAGCRGFISNEKKLLPSQSSATIPTRKTRIFCTPILVSHSSTSNFLNFCVETTKNSSDTLDLSGLGLRILEKNIFNNSPTLKSLNLDNNSLQIIPKRFFSQLVNLEHLSLANNNITQLKYAFWGLERLKTLNISNNPIKILEENALFGLSTSSLVFTKGLSLKVINSFVFKKPLEYDDDEEPEDDREKIKVIAKKIVNKETRKLDEEKTEINQDKMKVIAEKIVNKETRKLEEEKTEIIREKMKVIAEKIVNKETRKLDEEKTEINHEEMKVTFKGIVNEEKKYLEEAKTEVNQDKMKVTSNGIVNKDTKDLEEEKMKVASKEIVNKEKKDLEEDKTEVSQEKTKVTSKGIVNKEKKDVGEEKTEVNQEKMKVTSEEIVNNVKKASETEKTDINQKKEETKNPTTKMTRNVKVCIQNNVLKLVEPLKTYETMSIGCFQVKLKEYGSILCLDNLSITKFEKGWYQMQNTSITWLSLSGNEIIEMTKELLNDLPSEIRHIDLSRNKINHLERGIMNISHKLELNLSSNVINEIDDHAFANVNLIDLDLTANLLRDTNFTKTLPKMIYKIDLTGNKITEISSGSFSGLDQLKYLHLGQNLIEELNSDCFDNLPSLTDLELSNNRISIIDQGSFGPFPDLYSLDLRNNNISKIVKGVFDEIPYLGYLDLSYNKLSKLTANFSDALPIDLFTLQLGFNDIEILERRSFKKVPRYRLSLEGNKISMIENGAFDLPELLALKLNNNFLTQLDVESFDGLNQLLYLSLSANGIEKIPKGFARNLGKLRALNLDENPIKFLENGDFSGLEKSRHVLVFLDHVPIETIGGGVFSDK